MSAARPLPPYLVTRFNGWRATNFAENKAWYRRLAEEGQHPRAMIISCCDSRVQATTLFGADPGEFFIHRNIANLVPPFQPDGRQHGTSAAVEYAVTALKVAHVIVLGHSRCGGIQGCVEMCAGRAPELEKKSSFVGRWMDLLRPTWERLKDSHPEENLPAVMEREAILVSLENLMTFPFVRQAVEEEKLTLHGVWHDIGEGMLEHYVPEEDGFVPVV